MALFNKTFSDSELLDGIRNAHPNRRIFENRLYEKYAYMIREATWKHQLSDDECAMAYSDTILTALEHIETGRFKGLSSFKTYLSQIFSNKCIDLLRKNSAQKQATTRGEAIESYMHTLPDDSRGIIEKLIAQYDMDLLKTRIAELGDKCRQLILAWGDGFMDQEIAGSMGYQSAAVVKTSRLRCLDKLREAYGRKGTKG